MKKILWHSELVDKTGFANVSRSLIEHLKKSYDITALDWTKKFTDAQPQTGQEVNGHKIIGVDKDGDIMAFRKMLSMNLDVFDYVVIVNDVWHINEVLALLKHKAYKGKVFCYFPVDARGHQGDWYSNFDIVSHACTYTSFAYQEVLAAAPDIRPKLSILPHGIDTTIFYPMNDIKSLREKTLGSNKYNDHFIFLNANKNQPRKRLDITMQAFAMFAHQKENVALYMHCANVDSSMNILALAQRYRIDTNKLIMSPGADKGPPNVSESALNTIYNICDVGLNTSMGEGWGLTNTEHAACRKPQIVPDHSACYELFGGVGLLTHCIADYTFDNIMTIGQLNNPISVAGAMNLLYRDRPLYEDMAQRCYKKFTETTFLWKTIAGQLEGILENME